MRKRDRATMNRILVDFFYPFLEIRDRAPGYAVSIIKAGLDATGRHGGPVRPPLSNLTTDEVTRLAEIIKGARS